MKIFSEIRKNNKIEGQTVFSKVVKKHKVMISKTDKGFTVYIDGDKLDTYRSQREAEKMGKTFAKEM